MPAILLRIIYLSVLLTGLFIGLLLQSPSNPLSAQGPIGEPTSHRPFKELYLPLIEKVVSKPFPTDPAPPSPTATNTRRPTITPTETATGTSSPTPTLSPTRTATPTASATLAPGVTPSITPSPTVTRTPTRTQTPSVTPTATPSGHVDVLNYRVYRIDTAPQKQLLVVGEIRNDTESTVQDVVVRIFLLRDDLLPLTTVTAEVFATRIAAGHNAPFRVTVDMPSEYDSATVDVTAWTWTPVSPPPTLAPPTQTYQWGGNEPTLLGRVVNTTSGPIRQTRVVAVYRDGSNAVTHVVDSGIGADSPFGVVLDPGASTPFRIPLTGGVASGVPTYYLLYEPSAVVAPSPLPTRAVRVERETNHIDIFGEITNTTGGPIREAQVVASFYDANNNLVNADWVWVSQNADRILNPDQRAPFQITLDGPTANSWRRYELQTYHRSAPAPLPGNVNVENTTFQVSLDNLVLTLRGRIVNGSPVGLRQPRLVVTFFKDDLVQYTLSMEVTVAEGLASNASIDYILTHPLPRDVGPTLQGTTAVYAVDFLP